MDTMETERLRLRHYKMEDAEVLHHIIYSDDEVCRHFCQPGQTIEQVRRNLTYRICQYEQHQQFGHLAVIRKEDETLIGLVGIIPCLMWYHRFEGQDPRYNLIEVELMYAFGREYQKKGYAIEACRSVIQYAFKDLRIPRIAYGVMKDNVNSWGLMQRLGFEHQRDLNPDNGADVNIGVLNNNMV